MLVTMMPEQLLITTVMTGLHGKKELNSLKMPVFRSLSPGQHKLYPAVPKTEAKKKALEFSISKAFYGGGHGKKLNVYPLQLLRFRDLFFRQPHTRTQLINNVLA